MGGQLMDPVFADLLETLTGTHKVPYGDPFWNQLLAAPRLADALAADVASDNPLIAHFAQRMLASNLRSGNLSTLVYHTVHCLNLALGAAEGRGEGGPDFFMLEAANGMRLTAAFVGYLLAKAGGSDTVMEHLQPFFYDSDTPARAVAQTPTEGHVDPHYHTPLPGHTRRRVPNLSATGTALVPALLDALTSWLLSDAIDDASKLPAVDLLLALLSSQVYQGLGHQPAAGPSSNVFLEALLKEAVEQNERAILGAGDTSQALGFRMVRLLLTWFMHGGGLAATLRPPKTRQESAMSLASLTPRWLGGANKEASAAAPVGFPQAEGHAAQHPAQQEGGGGGPMAHGGGLLSVFALPFRTIYSLFFTGGSAAEAPASGSGSTTATSTPSRSSSSASLALAAGQPEGASGSVGGLFNRGANRGGVPAGASGSALSQRGTMLLLLLVHNRRSRGDLNLFRDAFCSVVDERYDDLVGDDEMLGHTSHSLKMPLDKLYAGLADNLHTEQGALLFYSLLIGNPLFLDTTLSRGDVELLFLPLLQQLYHTDRVRSPRQLYVLVIILLILTQDSAFNVGIFRRLILPSVPWYKERQLTNISLGSLCVLCVLRVLVYNLNRARDTYLLSNCSAILLNLAPQAERLHEYTALRLISVLTTVMRRYIKYSAGQDPLGLASPASSPSTSHVAHVHSPPTRVVPPAHSPARSVDAYGGMSSGVISAVLDSARSPARPAHVDEASYKEQLSEAMRMLLSVLNICVRPSLLATNVRLVHYLLYSQREIEPYFQNPCVVQLGYLGSLPMVMQHFGALIDEQEETLSVERAMQTLDKGARQLAVRLRQENPDGEPDLKFTYEEEADPESFFVPYIWEIVYRATHAQLLWFAEAVVMFDPRAGVGGGEDRDRGERTSSLGSSERSKGSLGSGAHVSEHALQPPPQQAAPPPVVLTMHV